MIERIRHWPWRYIGRRAVVTLALTAGLAPFLVGYVATGLLWLIVATWAARPQVRAGDPMVWLLDIPGRLIDWADEARPSLLEPTVLTQINNLLSQINSSLSGFVTALPMPEPAAPVLGIPDASDPVLIRGWRTYDIRLDRLYGLAGFAWEGAHLKASCHALIQPPGDCHAHLRAGTCTCGIYVAREMPRPWARPPVAPVAVAEVVGWGAYVEYERGWRCENVRIEKLYAWDTAWALEQRYGCPVELVREA